VSRLIYLGQFSSVGKVTAFAVQNIFGKDYKEYNIFLDLNDSAGNTAYIGMQFYDSSNTLINGFEYAHSGNELKSYASFDNTWATTNANQIGTISLSGNDDARGGGALIKVFNADDSSLFTHINSFSSCVNDSGANGFWAMGMHKVAETVTGFRFYNNTFDNDLTVTVYGVQD